MPENEGGFLKTVSYFEKCPNCGAHGHIVLSDKTESEEFDSIELGLEIALRLYEQRKLLSQEYEFIESSIKDSKMIETKEEAEVHERLFNAIRNHILNKMNPGFDCPFSEN